MAVSEQSRRGGWQRTLRLSWGLLAIAVIAYATLVVIGRQLLPHLSRYQPEINHYFSRQLGVSLQASGLSGEWPRLTPKLSARDIAVASLATPDAPALLIDSAEAELDLIASLRSGAPVWRELRLGNIKVTAVEGADGHWTIGGHGLRGGAQSGQLDRWLGALLLSKLIHVDEVALRLRFHSGGGATVVAKDLLTENSAGFHRTTAALAIPGGGESAQLVVEGSGDPRDLEQFEGHGYLRLDHINFSGPLRAIAKRWFPATAARIGDMKTAVATELWFDAGADTGIQLRGRLRAAEVPLVWASNAPPLRNLRANLSGWLRPGETWGLRLHGLDFDWADSAIDPLDLEIRQNLGAHGGGLAIAVDHIDLQTTGRMLAATGLAGEHGTEILRTLNPRGKLKALHLDLDPDQDQLVGVRVNVEKLSVDPGKDSPGARNISGYLEFAGNRGFFEMDSPEGFAMYYPQAYDDYMAHGATKGRVNLRWVPEESTIRIAGGPIVIDGEEGQGRAYIYLSLPIAHSGGEPEMFLLGGLRNSHSRYSRRYIPKELDPALRHWLDRAVGDTDIPAGGFIWRGSLRASYPKGRRILVYGKLANGTVDYDPGWPKITNLAAEFTVEGAHLQAEIREGTLGGAQLRNAVVETDHFQNGKLLLSVKAAVSAPLPTAVDILAASPLRARVARLQHWQLGGDTQADLDLAIPLTADKTGEHYRVSARIDRGRMATTNSGVVISDITGAIGYNDDAGLYSDQIAASLWGQALTGTLRTRDGETRIETNGTLVADQLPPWSPLIQRGISGVTDYRALLSLPTGPSAPTLSITSTLTGLAVTLPPPLAKAAAASKPVTATLTFAADALHGEATLGDDLRAVARFSDDALERATITLGGSPAQPPEHPGLLITGRLPRFDLADWLPWFGGNTGGFDLAALRPRFDVHLDELRLGGFGLPGVGLAGDYGANGWHLRVDSAVASGEVNIPANGVSSVNLNHLVLPKPQPGESGFLATLDPRHLPEIDFATASLRIGDRAWGKISFNARRLPAGLHFGNINADITGLAVGDKSGDNSSEETALDWLADDHGHRTHLTGRLQSADLGNVLKAWELPAIITSKEAAFIADLGWDDKPWNFTVAQLHGHVALNLRDGRFYRAPGVATNALMKLVGLVNFDTWLRRLRLDFTDLFASGVTYDHVRGGLRFDRGQLAFDEPIVVELPSGRLRLLGSADLRTETIDARLVATLPVSTNLPWIAALAGGLPAAAGVYLSGKLFKRQVDRLSSLSYRVTGSWDDPDLAVDKIFTDSTDNKTNSTDEKRQRDAEGGGDPTKK
ncbi:MAG: YhdP family protein [Porticoccaceae bacterium]